MARTVYEDARVTEYDDGTEEVRFSQDEERIMARNPRYFGYVLACGHPRSAAMGDGCCGACEGLGEEMAYAETEAEAQAIWDADAVNRAPADKDDLR